VLQGGDTEDMLTVTVQLKDKYGNDLTSPGPHNVTGAWQHVHARAHCGVIHTSRLRTRVTQAIFDTR
jgi:hypothetical protein